jgi:hypothetical protein
MEDVSQGSGGFGGQGATLLKGNLIYSPVASIMTTLPWQGTNYCGRDGLGDFPGPFAFLDSEEVAGDYRLEVQASDAAGRESAWRQVNFTID